MDFGAVFQGATERAAQIKKEQHDEDEKKFKMLMEMFNTLSQSKNPAIASEAQQASVNAFMDYMGYKNTAKPGRLHKLAQQFVGQQHDFSSSKSALEGIMGHAGGKGMEGPAQPGVGSGNATVSLGGIASPQPPGQPDWLLPKANFSPAPGFAPPNMEMPQQPPVMGPPPPPAPLTSAQIGLGLGPSTPQELLDLEAAKEQRIGDIKANQQIRVNAADQKAVQERELAVAEYQARHNPAAWKEDVFADPNSSTGLTKTYTNMETGEKKNLPYSDPAHEVQRATLIKSGMPEKAADKILAEALTVELAVKKAAIGRSNAETAELGAHAALLREQVAQLQNPFLRPDQRINAAHTIAGTLESIAKFDPVLAPDSTATDDEKAEALRKYLPPEVLKTINSLLATVGEGALAPKPGADKKK